MIFPKKPELISVVGIFGCQKAGIPWWVWALDLCGWSMAPCDGPWNSVDGLWNCVDAHGTVWVARGAMWMALELCGWPMASCGWPVEPRGGRIFINNIRLTFNSQRMNLETKLSFVDLWPDIRINIRFLFSCCSVPVLGMGSLRLYLGELTAGSTL